MQAQILFLLLLPLFLRLVEFGAVAKARYVHPSKADRRDLKAFPSVLRIFVDHHDAVKYGSALMLIVCVGWLSLGVGLSAVIDVFAKAAMFLSIAMLSVALSWRMFVIAR